MEEKSINACREEVHACKEGRPYRRHRVFFASLNIFGSELEFHLGPSYVSQSQSRDPRPFLWI